MYTLKAHDWLYQYLFTPPPPNTHRNTFYKNLDKERYKIQAWSQVLASKWQKPDAEGLNVLKAKEIC